MNDRRLNLTANLVAFWKDNRQELAAMALCAAVATVALTNYTQPTQPVPQWIGQLVMNFGLFAVVIYSAMHSVLDDSGDAAFTFLKASFKGFAANAVALWVIGTYGDWVFVETMARPHDAAALVVAFLVLREIVRFAHGRREPTIALARSQGRLIGELNVPTARDNRTTATHEAGHALIHAALENLPTDFVAVVGLDGRDRSFGHVSAVNEGHLITSRTFAEWKMLMLLGGLASEKKLLGEETLGGSGDYEKWLWTANAYLANGTRGVFYDQVGTPDKLQHNNAVLERLQRDQEAQLETFFALNVMVLGELSDTLLEKRRLDAQALAPFMERVVFPEWFPKPALMRTNQES